MVVNLCTNLQVCMGIALCMMLLLTLSWCLVAMRMPDLKPGSLLLSTHLI